VKYRIEFDIEVPDTAAANESEIEEWARHMVSDSSELLSAENPLGAKSFDPIFGTFKIRRAE